MQECPVDVGDLFHSNVKTEVSFNVLAGSGGHILKVRWIVENYPNRFASLTIIFRGNQKSRLSWSD